MRSLALVFLVACGGNNAATPDAVDLCTAACSAEISCGITVDATVCITNCKASPSTYQQCLQAAGGDCNKSALCYWEATCSFGPSGTGTCNDAANCQGTCNVNDPTLACDCACIATMAPAEALDLMINDFCAFARCPQFCTAGASYDGTACNACFAEQCQDQHAACVAH